jgi:pimeloyl-ACP methyl ester carboxylesterase
MWVIRPSFGGERVEQERQWTMTDRHIIKSGSAKLSVLQSGSGPPMVLLHPGVADQRCWAVVTRQLESSYSVVTYDRRGYGSTTYVEELHDPVDDLLAVLDGLDLGRVHLVGNSVGAGLAVDFALRHPDRVGRLVLISAAISGAPRPERMPDSVTELNNEIDRLEASGDLDATNELEARLWLDGPSRPAQTISGRPRELFVEMNGLALRAPSPGPVESRDEATAWERLGELATPTLCLVGHHDLPHLGDRMAAAAELIDGATFDILPNSAHVPQLDDPDHLAAVISEFIG